MGIFQEVKQEFLDAYRAGRAGPAAEEALRRKRQDKREQERVARSWIAAKTPAEQDKARKEMVDFVFSGPPKEDAELLAGLEKVQGERMTWRRRFGTTKEWREALEVWFVLLPLALFVTLIRRHDGKLGKWLQNRYRIT